MPLIKIDNHHVHHRHADDQRSPDPHLIWNKRTELLANVLMSLSYVTTTAFLIAATSPLITMSMSEVPQRVLHPEPLAWVIALFALVAIAAYASAHIVLGKLRQ